MSDSVEVPLQSIIATQNSLHYNGKQYTVLSSKLPAADWNLYLYTPTNRITYSARWISLTICLMICICFFIVLFVSKLFSRKMVYPIECLRQNIKMIENGTLEVTITSHSQDEIGDLIHGFGKMVGQIKHLIDEVYVAKIHQKEYEMKALQAQINPHFLYNSLSLINWRAIRIQADDISEMAQLLSSYYRTTLNKGNNLITVSDELINVQSYTKIQLIMHSNSFDVEYQIDDMVLSYMMPNLMLQPLIENAIIHGIENKEKERGKIILICEQRDNTIIFRVQDNGIGIPKEQISSLLQRQSKGYGIKNVNDRSRLQYGESYGLTIESIEDYGTTVTLTIPKI